LTLPFYESRLFAVQLEYVDKTNVFESAKCEPDEDYKEDGCLYQCLTDKFVQQFGCIHTR
jgi:hypothetical protein